MDLYFKKVKSKGISYLTIWEKNPEGKDIYKLTLGTAETCYKKFVRLGDLEIKDKQFKEIQDKLSSTIALADKDKLIDFIRNPRVLEEDK